MKTEEIAKTAIQEKMANVQILTGHAPEQYNPEPVSITGNIDAPSRFIEGKSEEFKDSARHCLVSKTRGYIILVINEQSVVNRYTVDGRITVGSKFESLGINKDNVGYNPKELANKLKLLRSIFVSNIEHLSICNTLRNLKAKINSDIEKLDDRKGNVTNNFQQTVESNMPDAITLSMPLIEGGEPIEFEVNIILEAEGASEIKCYLESVDAAEMIENLFEQRVQQEIEKIQDWVTVIEQ